MIGVLVFGAVLLVASAISGLARRSILSTAVLFLVAGFVAGRGGFDVLRIQPTDRAVALLAEVALFTVLFTDGMRAGLADLRGAWRLPGRVLLVGLPATFAITAVLARLLGGLSWTEALLVAAALSPTDPVLASAIVGRQEVPGRVRHLLNVESGLNDGLALPVVVVMVDIVASRPVDVPSLAAALLGGVLIGIVIPLLAVWMFRVLPIEISERYEALAPVAIGMLVLAVADESGANVFLAAFAAGSTMATTAPSLRRAFTQFGELTTELLKLAALLVLGALVTVGMFRGIGLSGVIFVILALTVTRAIAVGIALAGTDLDRKEYLTIAWFGPKGFASVVYALLIVSMGLPDDRKMFGLIAVTVVASIVAHSSTDIAFARWFEPDRREGEPDATPRGQPGPESA